MLTNAKVGTKLLALIVAPVMVLLAVASLGARDRLDEAADAERVEDAAVLTALTDSAVRSLGTERLLSTAQVAGGRTEGVDQARAATDEALARLRPALSSVADADELDDRLDQAGARLDDIEGLRSSIDGGDVSAEVVIDSFTLAIDELLRVESDVVAVTSAAELSLALADANVLSRAEEARSEMAAQGAIATGSGEYEPGALELYTDLVEEQDRFLARFADSAPPEAATGLGDALATPEVVAADAQLEQLISDATMGGAGEPRIELDAWVTRQGDWLGAVGAVDADLVRNVRSSAADSAFSATKSAQLFMIVTAGATLLSVLLAVWVARSIDRPLRRLTAAANELATDRLPRLVENLRSPDPDNDDMEAIEPLEVRSSDEIGQMTEAFNAIQQVTVTVAEEQSILLRKGIGDIFVNLARRNQSLLDRQIEFIDELESKEQDPDLLENLFRLDHLATRMRRNAESLLVLAGAEPARRRAKPVALTDVGRVALGEVEDFTRVELLDLDNAIVAGNLAVDLSHLLSELMENATHFSPPETAVEVGGQFGSDGAYVLTVADHGIGMSGDDLTQANQLLANPPLVGLALGRSLGFVVVGRIADRLGLRVHLNASPAGGVTAVIALPPDLVARPGDPEPRDPLLDRNVAVASMVTTSMEAAPSTLEQPDDVPLAFPTDSDPSTLPPPPAAPPLPAPPRPPAGADPEPDFSEAGADDLAPADPAEGLTEPPTWSIDDPASLPERRPQATTPTEQLSAALPVGEEFDQGLASLIGPEVSDEDVEHQFWGSLADEDEPEREPEPTADEPELLVDEVPAVGAPAEPTPEPAPEPEVGTTGLVRRVPGAAAKPPPAMTPTVDAPRRSPEQVRAMLSRYRDGRRGEQDPDAVHDVSTTEES